MSSSLSSGCFIEPQHVLIADDFFKAVAVGKDKGHPFLRRLVPFAKENPVHLVGDVGVALGNEIHGEAVGQKLVLVSTVGKKKRRISISVMFHQVLDFACQGTLS
jgi:hypothetical protein